MRVNINKLKEVFKNNKHRLVLLGYSAILVSGYFIGIGSYNKAQKDKKENVKNTNDLIHQVENEVDDLLEEFKKSNKMVDVYTTTYGRYMNGFNEFENGSSFAIVPFDVEYADNGFVIDCSLYEEYTKYAKDKGLEIGYMFNPTSTDRASMYLSINKLKDIMTKYDVNYPIIYNLDCLYNNHSEQDREYNYSIAASFIDKMHSNNCYVMLGGSKETIEDMKNRFKPTTSVGSVFHSIDKIVFDDVELTDEYCMKMVNNKIESRFNYTAFIDSYGYNDSKHFVEDYIHVVKPTDSLSLIANYYEFNEYNIKKYNNKYGDFKLYNGQQLAIPSNIIDYGNVKSIRYGNYEKQEKLDNLVSFNGTYIKDKDTDLSLNNCDFALIEYSNIFDENGNITYKSGNYAVSKCSDANVPFGIVVAPKGVRLADIYCTIKNLKVFIKPYEVNYPILYDVDAIFNSNYEHKYNYDLSKAFVEKLSYDGCFTGFIGTQENILKLRKLYEDNNDLDTFNKYFVALRRKIQEDITYDKNVGMYAFNYGEITTNKDIEGIVKKRKLNKTTNFKDDFSYEVKAGDTLESLSKKFNLKTWNIIMYNKQYDLNNGVKAKQVLYFPNILKKTEDYVEENNVQLPINMDSNGKYYVGIDVSDNQKKINWDALAGNIDYAIIKFGNGWFFNGFGGYQGEDKSHESTFEYNYSECKRLGISVGLYVFSNYYMEGTTNENYQDEAKREAEYAAKYLHDHGYTLELPLYMDYEPRTSCSMYENVTPEIMANIIRIQKETIESYGYYYGLYTGEHFYNTTIRPSNLNVETWLAHYVIEDGVTVDVLRNATPTCENMESIYVNNNQISSGGNLPGINGRVDVNIADQQLIDNCNEFYKRLN